MDQGRPYPFGWIRPHVTFEHRGSACDRQTWNWPERGHTGLDRGTRERLSALIITNQDL